MYQNMYNNPAPMGNYNPYEQNSGLLKTFFSKPVVIILAAVGGVSALISIISFFMQIGTLDTTIRYYNYMMGGQFASFYSNIKPLFIIFSICSIAMTIINALGYFLLYSKSKNPDPQSNPKAGSTLLWVISIISFVVTCILAVFLIIVAFILFIASGEVSRYEASIMTTVGVAMIIVALVFFFYFLFQFRFFSSIHTSFSSVQIVSKSSVAFAVFSIIFCVFAFISLFTSLDTATAMTVISGLLSIVNSVFLAVFALSYNSFVKSVTTGANPIGGFMPNNGQFNPYNQNTNGQAPNMNMGYSYRPQQPPVNDNNQFNGQQYQNPYGSSQQSSDADKAYKNPYFSQDFEEQTVNPQNDIFNQNPVQPEEQAAQNKCPMCGAVHSGDDLFCGNCGARLK
ncbi:MAG: zinc ribbon domain-containing protein [Acutalibacteraceae bacterium]|nr:zinc ribbon domain-containing protein [Acutalibacteraceae bacterium]